MPYTKHYIPLECNPEVFTDLIHQIGVSTALEFQDVYSLEDPVLLASITRPVLALILVFSTSGDYEGKLAAREAARSKNDGREDGNDVIWFKQTIHNACGLYAILHAVCNGEARNTLVPDSTLAELLKNCLPLSKLDRAKTLEDSRALETAHRAAALRGDSKVPENAEDEVDYHYVCLVKSSANHHLYELDGDLEGLMDHGTVGLGEDMLGESGLDFARKYIQERMDDDIGFSLLALVPSSTNTGAGV